MNSTVSRGGNGARTPVGNVRGRSTTGGRIGRALRAVGVFGSAAFDVVVLGRDGLAAEAGVRRPA
ncbi:hypothetical protein FH609_013030 [Streptomyces sp. 3MP-14]|uniref:Uncharacterized protein n=1 Tax=Streptomyces mimosae TaxID=2586635 RepID=A0A5N6A818_9ACTN|nr:MULTISPECIES: hypothetical protein [Streptomyces]KAB8164143.1 hypothetical protein FH607_015920 [Streptomyces mimosae]KAB8176420.1 hypothetical protein FH609_013030 [Streptomyces sp. 3MP-14]